VSKVVALIREPISFGCDFFQPRTDRGVMVLLRHRFQPNYFVFGLNPFHPLRGT